METSKFFFLILDLRQFPDPSAREHGWMMRGDPNPETDQTVNDEALKFLNLVRLPGSISAEQAAILLGISDANIPVLIAKKFLHPLGGRIKPNAPKRFSSHAIMKLVDDPEEMDRMHSILTVHYRLRNGGFGGSGLKSVA